MPSPYRQQRGDTAVKSFGKSLGKTAAIESIKKLTPTAGLIANAMGQIESAASNAGNYMAGKGLTKGLGAMSGGGLASILTSPNEIANDPMEGGYGAMLDSERFYQNSAIDRGEQMGPPVPAGDIRRIVDAQIDEGQNRAEIARKKKEQQSAFGISQLIGLLSSMGTGIR